jgi:hypothetical protein
MWSTAVGFTTCPTEEVDVSIIGADAVMVSSCSAVPTCRAAFNMARWATCSSTSVALKTLKPGAVTVTE